MLIQKTNQHKDLYSPVSFLSEWKQLARYSLQMVGQEEKRQRLADNAFTYLADVRHAHRYVRIGAQILLAELACAIFASKNENNRAQQASQLANQKIFVYISKKMQANAFLIGTASPGWRPFVNIISHSSFRLAMLYNKYWSHIFRMQEHAKEPFQFQERMTMLTKIIQILAAQTLALMKISINSIGFYICKTFRDVNGLNYYMARSRQLGVYLFINQLKILSLQVVVLSPQLSSAYNVLLFNTIRTLKWFYLPSYDTFLGKPNP